MQDRPIIVGIDDEGEARDAVALGVTLARAMQAPIVLAGICVAVPGPAAVGHLDVTRTITQERLDRVLTYVPGALRSSTVTRVASSVAKGLHELAEHQDAAAIVFGPSHLGRVARAALGDVALTTMNGAPCAVAIAPEGFADRAEAGLARVGVALIDTPEARDALDLAIEVAEDAGARLELVHVGPDTAMSFASAEVARAALEEADRDIERLLDDARRRVAGRVPVETLVRQGDAANELIAAAAGLDLLVLGSRCHGPARRLLLGSVSGHVLHAAPCPLLILPRGAAVGAPVRA